MRSFAAADCKCLPIDVKMLTEKLIGYWQPSHQKPDTVKITESLVIKLLILDNFNQLFCFLPTRGDVYAIKVSIGKIFQNVVRWNKNKIFISGLLLWCDSCKRIVIMYII